MSQALEAQIKAKLSIASYLKQFVDHNIDIPEGVYRFSICCPFHEEKTPSFVINLEKETARCYGRCGDGGDVIALHRMHHKLKNRDAARKNLASMLGIKEGVLDLTVREVEYDENLVQYGVALNRATKLAKTIDDYLELDYIMSQHRPHHEIREQLEFYINKRSVIQ